MQRHESLYRFNEDVLRDANPDLIVTQELCEVCAIDAAQVSDAVRVLSRRPKLVSLHPHTLSQMLEEIRLVGDLTDRREEAEQLVGKLTERIEAVKRLVAGRPKPRVFCLEWLKPSMASGHWVPEQVELAGGHEVLGQAGQPSRYVTWDEIAAAQPEVLLLMPCGFSIERTRRELPVLEQEPVWRTLPAVRNRQVYLVNGPAFFNRSGPRLVDGIELLAGLLHPERCEGLMPCEGVEPI
jgi:iron complex transport system substrate-binding protein